MAEKLIELDSVELAAAVFGSCDENIRLLEKEFSVTAVCRGTQVKLTGEAEGVTGAANAIDAMLTLLENHTPIEEQTVRYCISLARSGEDGRVQELTENFIAITAKGRPVRPKTLGQKEYLKAIQTHPITFGVGPAGTGKTYLAVAMAVKAFKSKDVERIILTRPAVEAGEKLGLTVYCGWELTYQDNAEDYLTLGLSPQFLYDHPWLERYDIEKYRDAVHAAGGILVRAHPYRRAWYIKKPYVEREGIADAIEVFNGGNSSQEENDMALAYAQKHNMPMTGGSDAHHVDETARGYIALEKKAESYAELCEAIRTGKAIVMHK